MLMTSCFGGSTPILGRKRITLLQPCGLRVTELDIFFLVGKFLSDIWSGRLTFFVGHFEKMSDCPTSPTNFDCSMLRICRFLQTRAGCSYTYSSDVLYTCMYMLNLFVFTRVSSEASVLTHSYSYLTVATLVLELLLNVSFP